MKDSFHASGVSIELEIPPSNEVPQIEGIIDETEHSIIYRALFNGRIYAIKSIKPSCKDFNLYQRQLKREFQLLQQLQSPYIVQAWDFREINNLGFCIVMEYIDGVSINQWCRNKPSRNQRRQVLDELLETFAYLHSKQIIHGDIKPQNILVCQDGHIKVIDFDFSSKDEYVTNNIGHTTIYAAPEQKVGHTAKIDNRADIYAIGHIIHLLFPHRYWYISHRCRQSNPNKRYPNISDIQKSIRYQWLWIFLPIVIGIIMSFFFFNNPVNEQPTYIPIRDTIPTMLPTKIEQLKSAAEQQTAEIIATHEQQVQEIRERHQSCRELAAIEIDSLINQSYFSLKAVYNQYSQSREIRECAYKIHELHCRKAVGDFVSRYPDCVEDVRLMIQVDIQTRIQTMEQRAQRGYSTYDEQVAPAQRAQWEKVYQQLTDSLETLQKMINPIYESNYLKQFE